MKAILLACLLTAAAAGPARATAPLAVAQVYRNGLGGLAIDFSVGGWTFSENGRDLYVSGGDIFNVAGLMAHLSLDPASGALTFVDAVRDEFGPPYPFGGLSGATALGPVRPSSTTRRSAPCRSFGAIRSPAGFCYSSRFPGRWDRPPTMR